LEAAWMQANPSSQGVVCTMLQTCREVGPTTVVPVMQVNHDREEYIITEAPQDRSTSGRGKKLNGIVDEPMEVGSHFQFEQEVTRLTQETTQETKDTTVIATNSGSIPGNIDPLSNHLGSERRSQTSNSAPLHKSHFVEIAFPKQLVPELDDEKKGKRSDTLTRIAQGTTEVDLTHYGGLQGYLRQGSLADRLEHWEKRHPLVKQILGPFFSLILHMHERAMKGTKEHRFMKLFEVVCVAVILLNTGLLWYLANEELDQVQKDGTYTPDDWMFVTEVLFLGFYCIEIALKLYVHRAYFFFSDDALWNLSDCVLVIFSLSEIVLNKSEGVNVSYLRGIRVLRVAKLFRMFRVLRMVQEIKLLVDCVVGSINSLVWSFVLLTLLLSFFSMFFVTAVANALRDGNALDAEVRHTLLEMFPSVGQGMITLFMAVSGGMDWGWAYEALKATSLLNAYVFLLMIITFYIAVWNVVSSIFVERAMRFATPSLQQQMVEKRMRDEQDARDLLRVCKKLDVDQSGTLNCQEFSRFSSIDEFKSYFEVSGLDIRNAENFFQSLTAVTGRTEMDLQQFVAVCMRLRGMASSVDVHMLMVEMHILYEKIVELQGGGKTGSGSRHLQDNPVEIPPPV